MARRTPQKQRTISMSYRSLMKLLLILSLISLLGCYAALKREASYPKEALTRVRFFYPKFHDDMDYASLARSIRNNLEYLNRLDPEFLFSYGTNKFSCLHVRNSQKAFLQLIAGNPNPKELNDELKKRFWVYKAAGRAGNRKVLFTGYYEPIYEGSLTHDSVYRYPIYRKPKDLIQINLSLFKEKFAGESIIARIDGKEVLPYFSRKQIEEDDALAGRGLEIAWLKNPLDVAFLHIQGSGRLRLPDGSTFSVGYQATNGRPYQSIGRYLVDRGMLNHENVSMQSIRAYLTDHPEILEKVLNYNPSYVFFRHIENGPFGNINVPLTAGRSIALDSRLFPKGAICFVSSEKPEVNERNEIREWTRFSRFFLNQDTGGAVKGSGRADIFWGSGTYAELVAGHMKQEGDLFVLIMKPEE
jgi:membrane-bound lytic murein transglycosylase A